MMIYVMIMIATLQGYSHGHSAVTAQEFASKESCEAAAEVVRQAGDGDVKVRCVPK